ncbi:hypothetical protein B0H19DRAFT_967794 [Mycena capillaripes]|nr:hypothetical protein B0H19DRAFT_967794 [Mycena capillaripes]
MRYGACTEDDIEFLESRIAGFRPENPELNEKDIRNVSIITARNSQKDALNKMGAERFAQDTNQTLVDFCSIDRLSARSVDRGKWKGCIQSEIKKMTVSLQKKLWDAPPSTTNEFIPGKLSLCLGMPIMLRANDATELCMTKGQEAVVCGWDSSEGPSGQQVLDTLFVHLVNSPRKIQIGDLPENVIPLVRTVTHITVLLEDDTLLSVLREQVVCLLNFGMTDYTSQGKSRAKNPVELTHCRDHRSYYVALSRGFTADGTVIVQGFSAKKITSGMSGYLRQELRELEILDEITRLRCEGALPRSVTGLYRRSFYTWKKDHRDPAHFHPAMRWDASTGPRAPEDEVYTEWRPSIPVSKKRKNAAVGSNDAYPYKNTARTKESLHEDPENRADNTQNTTGGIRHALPVVQNRRIAVGFLWDSRNYSCGYDATFTILGNIWLEDVNRWTAHFAYLSGTLGEFATALQAVVGKRITFEQARDLVRQSMNAARPDCFPYGQIGTSIDRIAQILLPSKFYATGKQSCNQCGYTDAHIYGMLESYLSVGLSNRYSYPEGVQLRDWLTRYMAKGRQGCPICRQNGLAQRLHMLTTLRDIPPIMLFDINHDRIVFSEELVLVCEGTIATLRLQGIIYGGQRHFTCRFIDEGGDMWFHDGITTGKRCLPEINIHRVTDKLSLHRCGEKKAVAVIYARTG